MNILVTAVVAAVIAVPAAVLVGWGMWLLFAALIGWRYGVAGLKALGYVSDGFKIRAWAMLNPWQALAGLFRLLSTVEDPLAGSAVPTAAREAEWPRRAADPIERSDEPSGGSHDAA